MVLLSRALRPLVARGSRSINAGLAVASAAVALGGRAFGNWPGVPFALSLWLAALATLLGVISWNSVGDAFDVRSFKHRVQWVGATGTVGATTVERPRSGTPSPCSSNWGSWPWRRAGGGLSGERGLRRGLPSPRA
ncbi:MAG: hypothetical protein D6731_14370 [Planctomycetota bacterium]|nr:MAG: hypothetical protein D6731_14370 [Planctomycetota bacterium]